MDLDFRAYYPGKGFLLTMYQGSCYPNYYNQHLFIPLLVYESMLSIFQVGTLEQILQLTSSTQPVG